MRVSLEWLSEYVDIAGLAPEEIAEALTNSGLEVEAIHTTGGQFTGVKVARITAVNPHPKADRLRLVTVAFDVDGTHMQQVVCGATNVAVNQLIAFADVGSQVLSGKTGSLFTLEKASIRGVDSCGMICSLPELGLLEQYSGYEPGHIWVLNSLVSEAQMGQDLKFALNLETDTILETAPGANRGDLMSMFGVAREVAALFNRKLHLPAIDEERLQAPTSPVPFSVALKEPDVCGYYGGLIVSGIRNPQSPIIGEAPGWMQRRLQAAGVRTINTVVDVTNYIMLEMGQPLHAFDAEKLLSETGSSFIHVRRAMAEETLTTLDSVTHTLSPEAVLITHNNTPIAMAGVMGGKSSEIDQTTQNIFLESAFFPAVSTRRSARSVGIRTEASARFERGVDRATCRLALARAISLLEKVTSGKIIGVLESSSQVSPKQASSEKDPIILLRLARVERILGISLSAGTVQQMLEKLGFQVQLTKPERTTFQVQVPSFRQADIQQEIDLVEEVIRIYGYDKVPYAMPAKTTAFAPSLRQTVLTTVHHTLTGAGLQEVVTTSLLGKKLLSELGMLPELETLVELANSHSQDHTLMRQSLMPTLLEVARNNQSQGIEDVWIYELGRTYFKRFKPSEKASGVVETLCLGGLLMGHGFPGQWHEKRTTDFYTAKGMVASVLERLGFQNQVQYVPDTSCAFLHPGRTASVEMVRPAASAKNAEGKAGFQTLGFVGQLHPALQESLKFRSPVVMFQLDMELLLKLLKQSTLQNTGGSAHTARPSMLPSVKRDMAFLAPITLTHQDILNTLQAMAHEEFKTLTQAIDLFDEYRGVQVKEGFRSLAYRLVFQASNRTLTDIEVDTLLQQVKDHLQKALQVEFR